MWPVRERAQHAGVRRLYRMPAGFDGPFGTLNRCAYAAPQYSAGLAGAIAVFRFANAGTGRRIHGQVPGLMIRPNAGGGKWALRYSFGKRAVRPIRLAEHLCHMDVVHAFAVGSTPRVTIPDLANASLRIGHAERRRWHTNEIRCLSAAPGRMQRDANLDASLVMRECGSETCYTSVLARIR